MTDYGQVWNVHARYVRLRSLNTCGVQAVLCVYRSLNRTLLFRYHTCAANDARSLSPIDRNRRLDRAIGVNRLNVSIFLLEIGRRELIGRTGDR